MGAWPSSQRFALSRRILESASLAFSTSRILRSSSSWISSSRRQSCITLPFTCGGTEGQSAGRKRIAQVKVQIKSKYRSKCQIKNQSAGQRSKYKSSTGQRSKYRSKCRPKVEVQASNSGDAQYTLLCLKCKVRHDTSLIRTLSSQDTSNQDTSNQDTSNQDTSLIRTLFLGP